MRYVAVYANKNPNTRKHSSLGARNTVSRNRVLKLKAILLLMVGEDLEGARKNEGESVKPEPPLPSPIVEDAVVEEKQQQHPDQDQPDPLSPSPPSDDDEHDLLGFWIRLTFPTGRLRMKAEDDAEEQQQQPPEPPPLENAVVEEEQQHPHQDQDQDQADSPSSSSSSSSLHPPPPPPDDHSEDNLLGLNLDDFSDWLDEQHGQNAEDDPDFFLNWDPLQPAPAAFPVPEMVGLYATSPFVSDINGEDDDDNGSVSSEQKPRFEEENDDDHDSVRQWLESGGDPMQMRSMDKESGKRLKKANAFGLVTLLTFGFIAARIAFIWALYSVYGSNFFPQKEGQGDEETTFSTPISNI